MKEGQAAVKKHRENETEDREKKRRIARRNGVSLPPLGFRSRVRPRVLPPPRWRRWRRRSSRRRRAARLLLIIIVSICNIIIVISFIICISHCHHYYRVIMFSCVFYGLRCIIIVGILIVFMCIKFAVAVINIIIVVVFVFLFICRTTQSMHRVDAVTFQVCAAARLRWWCWRWWCWRRWCSRRWCGA